MRTETAIGELSLRFRKRADGRTYLAEQYFKLPLQIMTPYYQDQDGTAFVYLLNPSGGILQHDRLYTRAVLEEGARALLTTPASTKYYKMDEGYAAIANDMTVEREAVLEYLPEHNVPFADSKTYVENNFYLHEEAVLIASDMLTAGRVSRGERFQYDCFATRTNIHVGGKLIACDNGILRPKQEDMNRLGFMEGFSSNGSMYLYKKNMAKKLVQEMNDADWNERVRFGGTAVDDSLVIARFIGENILDMQETLLQVWETVRFVMLGKHSVRIRKY